LSTKAIPIPHPEATELSEDDFEKVAGGLSVPGACNIENGVAASAAGLRLGVAAAIVAEALAD
jgi:hypothetical protein